MSYYIPGLNPRDFLNRWIACSYPTPKASSALPEQINPPNNCFLLALQHILMTSGYRWRKYRERKELSRLTSGKGLLWADGQWLFIMSAFSLTFLRVLQAMHIEGKERSCFLASERLKPKTSCLYSFHVQPRCGYPIFLFPESRCTNSNAI